MGTVGRDLLAHAPPPLALHLCSSTHSDSGIRAANGPAVGVGSGAGRSADEVEVGAAEVVADAQKRLVGLSADGIGEAIAEVQGGRVAAFAVSDEGVDCDRPVVNSERDDGHAGLVEEAGQQALAGNTEPGDQHDAGFYESGSSYPGVLGDF